MRALITGSSGFIGSHLIRVIKSATPYDLAINRDIRDTELLKKAMKDCDIVIHLAAHTSVVDSWKDPTEYYDNNVKGTSAVVETAIKLGVQRIIFASSSAVYASSENPYAASKAMCEHLFHVRKQEIPSIMLRFFNVYGKGQNPNYGTVVPAFIKGIKKGKITIYGDGKQTRDFIHVDDVCRLIKTITETKFGPKSPAFMQLDVGTGKSYSVEELAYILMGLIGKKAKIKYAPPRKEAKHSQANTQGIKKMFNFDAQIGLIDGLKRLLNEGL